MTITAKFASRCATCGQTITPGTKIEWTKGAPVRHTSCGNAPQTTGRTSFHGRTAHARLHGGGGKWTGCSCGSREGQVRDSDCASCRFDELD